MDEEGSGRRLARLLRRWRAKRRASQRVLAGFAGVAQSALSGLERGQDAQLSTWDKLFRALGCRIVISVEETELAEECEDYLLHETDRRHWRRVEWLDRRHS